jgi:hypothetical protein
LPLNQAISNVFLMQKSRPADGKQQLSNTFLLLSAGNMILCKEFFIL